MALIQDGPYARIRRYLVTFQEDRFPDGMKELEGLLGLGLKHGDTAEALSLGVGPNRSQGLQFPRLRAAVVLTTPDAFERMQEMAGPSGPFLTAEPVGALGTVPIELPFVDGNEPTGGLWEEDKASTWGLKAIGLNGGTGAKVRVAILDTGFGPCKSIKADRIKDRQSFHPYYPNETRDDNGHGTMCTGIACGGKTKGKRFGIAHKSEIYIGRVASAMGSSHPEYVLNGLSWALEKGCHVASLSLAMDRRIPNPDQGFNEIGKAAKKQGMVIVAAAGNSAPLPVVSPASAENILAVGAIDQKGQVYPRSCPSGPGSGQQVDIAAPGVSIFAPTTDGSEFGPFIFATGTSLAVPHVTGIAALLFEKGMSADDVVKHLTAKTSPLPPPPARPVAPTEAGKIAQETIRLRPFVGGGLVKAP